MVLLHRKRKRLYFFDLPPKRKLKKSERKRSRLRAPPGFQKCRFCRETKPLDAEHYHTSKVTQTGYILICKPCRYGIIRRSRWRKDFNLSEERYDRILESQNYSCAICGLMHRDLIVHYEKTMKRVCGILCRSCHFNFLPWTSQAEYVSRIASYFTHIAKLYKVTVMPVEDNEELSQESSCQEHEQTNHTTSDPEEEPHL